MPSNGGSRIKPSRAEQIVVDLADIHESIARDLRKAGSLCSAIGGGVEYNSVVRRVAKSIRTFGDQCHDYGRKLERLTTEGSADE
jgi:hypothetical protein